MTIQDTLTRAAPVAQAVWEDGEVQKRVKKAADAGRDALAKTRRGAPPPSVAKRVGTAMAEAGRAVAAAASRAEQPKPTHRGRRLVAVLVLGGAAAAAYATTRSGPQED